MVHMVPRLIEYRPDLIGYALDTRMQHSDPEEILLRAQVRKVEGSVWNLKNVGNFEWIGHSL